MKVLKYIGLLILGFILLFGSFLVYATINDYTPQSCEGIFKTEKSDTLQVSDEISILSWNIGYAGLDREMDFFYDGGTKMQPSEEQTNINIKKIAEFIQSNDSLNFIFLQEVDKNAKRSYGIDQVALLDQVLPNHKTYFAYNYNVPYVPLPVYAPMGHVESGINTLSKRVPFQSERHSFPYNFSWPQKVFLLDRCFLVNYYLLDNGKYLALINTHNSAFDDNGEIRKAELIMFRDFLLNEYNAGNYVISGGDFNQSPPRLNTDFGEEPFDFDDYISIPDTLLPQGWNYVFDNSIPSNRRVIDAYHYGETKVTLIDFFITSPNVEVKNIKCINLGFENSDHNPIIGTFALKNDSINEIQK